MLFQHICEPYLVVIFVFDNLDLLSVVGIDWLFAKCLVLIIEINTEIVFETFNFLFRCWKTIIYIAEMEFV